VKLTVSVTHTDGSSGLYVCGPRALSAAEQNYNIKVATDGLAIEHLAYAVWAQAGIQGEQVGHWKDWWRTIDDLTVLPTADPTGPGTAPSPGSSSASPSEPTSPTPT